MKMIIVTGLSGAGKTQAIRSFEDLGYFCVDNLPPALIPKFSALCAEANSEINKVALVIDIRGREFFDDLLAELNRFKDEEVEHEILFLDSSDEVLVKRFKEARRKHPLAPNDRVIDGIIKERAKLKELKDRASNIIDTSNTKPRDLKERIEKIYGEENQVESKLAITVLSFGFKYGIPVDSDLVVDVRFLPNPFYVPELKPMSGNDEAVSDYVKSFEVTTEFISKYCDTLEFLIPHYFKEGKRQLIISIGCTGGRHRSVTIAREVFKFLEERGHFVTLEHRDINEDILKGGKKL